MSSNSKLIQKQLRTLIPSMAEKDLGRVFEALRQTIGESIQYTCKEISYKCYEGTLTIKGKRASGYGRNDQEAYCHAIKNLLQMLIDEEEFLFLIRHCIKKVSEPEQIIKQKENQPRKSLSIKPNLSTSTNFGQINEGRKSKAHLKSGHIESLNISLHKPNNKSEVELELEGAKIYITQLEQRLKNLEEENKTLKGKVLSQSISTSHPCPIPIFPTNNISTIKVFTHNNSEHDLHSRLSFDPKHAQSHYSQNEKFIDRLNCSVEDVGRKSVEKNQDIKLKVTVPKLKLEILPSFHGKSNKSINHSFLAHQQATGN